LRIGRFEVYNRKKIIVRPKQKSFGTTWRKVIHGGPLGIKEEVIGRVTFNDDPRDLSENEKATKNLQWRKSAGVKAS